MDSELTASEKAAIIDKFIRCTPSGELEFVTNDLNCLLEGDKNSGLYRSAIDQSSARYREEQLFPVEVPGCDPKCLISAYNCLDNDRYYDPRTKQSFSFDPVTGKGSDFQEEGDSRLAAERPGGLHPSLDHAVAGYVKTRYPNGNSSVFVVDRKLWNRKHTGGQDSNSGEPGVDDELFNRLGLDEMSSNLKVAPLYAICIECHNYQWQNFWTGSWRSQWILCPTNHQNQYTLIGIAKVQVHYYEDSNIQLRGQKKFNVQVDISSSGNLVSEIVKAISSTEDNYQLSINECQAKMSEQIFKSLRRKLPVTKSKINWDVMVSYRDMRELDSIDQLNDSRGSS